MSLFIDIYLFWFNCVLLYRKIITFGFEITVKSIYNETQGSSKNIA